jgi:hypothetical protein
MTGQKIKNRKFKFVNISLAMILPLAFVTIVFLGAQNLSSLTGPVILSELVGLTFLWLGGIKNPSIYFFYSILMFFLLCYALPFAMVMVIFSGG